MYKKLNKLSQDLAKIGSSKESLEVGKFAASKDLYDPEFNPEPEAEELSPGTKEWHEDIESAPDITTYHKQPRIEWGDEYPAIIEDSLPFQHPRYDSSNFKPENFSNLFPEEELPGWQKAREEAGKHTSFETHYFPSQTSKRKYEVELYNFLGNTEDDGWPLDDLGQEDVKALRERAKDYFLSSEAQELLEKWIADKGFDSPMYENINKRQLERRYAPDLYEGDFSTEVPIGKDIEQIEESDETKVAKILYDLVKKANDLDNKHQFILADQIDNVIKDFLK